MRGLINSICCLQLRKRAHNKNKNNIREKCDNVVNQLLDLKNSYTIRYTDWKTNKCRENDWKYQLSENYTFKILSSRTRCELETKCRDSVVTDNNGLRASPTRSIVIWVIFLLVCTYVLMSRAFYVYFLQFNLSHKNTEVFKQNCEGI